VENVSEKRLLWPLGRFWADVSAFGLRACMLGLSWSWPEASRHGLLARGQRPVTQSRRPISFRWYKVRNRSAQHTPFSVSSTQRDAGEAAVAELGDELGDGENGPGATGFSLAQRKWVVAVLVSSLGVGGLPAAKTAR
jgi:hypothetical protein